MGNAGRIDKFTPARPLTGSGYKHRYRLALAGVYARGKLVVLAIGIAPSVFDKWEK
jgi:hypothetical protein